MGDKPEGCGCESYPHTCHPTRPLDMNALRAFGYAEMAWSVERAAVVNWLRMVSRARDDRADLEWAECLAEAADFIEKGEHLKYYPPASVGRNPEGHDRATGHGRNDEHAVSSETSADAPPLSPLNHPIKE